MQTQRAVPICTYMYLKKMIIILVVSKIKKINYPLSIIYIYMYLEKKPLVILIINMTSGFFPKYKLNLFEIFRRHHISTMLTEVYIRVEEIRGLSPHCLY